jgi:hypothetical protein
MVTVTSAAWAGCLSEPEILEQLLQDRKRLIEAGKLAGEELEAFDRKVDEHAGQKDAVQAGLYWYRDLERAKQVAATAGKPILSLRLLGQLDCDLSCANSRFFRTVLYANAEVSAFLREQFVLHWESVRPVPVISIDFGDGRVLRRTVTGNSIHYVLTPEGKVLDALPGLYGPRRFQQQLQLALAVAGRLDSAPDADAVLRTYHAGRLSALEGALAQHEFARRLADAQVPPDGGGFPTAADAAPRAMGKAMVEAPLVRAATGEDPGDPRGSGPSVGPVTLDARSRDLMRTKVEVQRREGDAFEALVSDFEAVVAEDMGQNELVLRPQILRRLLAEGAGDVAALNRWVYAEVFLTPDEDPWLGLDSGAYSALDGAGLLTE